MEPGQQYWPETRPDPGLTDPWPVSTRWPGWPGNVYAPVNIIHSNLAPRQRPYNLSLMTPLLPVASRKLQLLAWSIIFFVPKSTTLPPSFFCSLPVCLTAASACQAARRCSLQMPLHVDAYVLLACSNDSPQRTSRGGEGKSFRGFMPRTVVVNIRLQPG